jgi:hypothetical protein
VGKSGVSMPTGITVHTSMPVPSSSWRTESLKRCR